MAERNGFGFVEDGIERFQSAVRSVESEVQKVQKRFEKRRRDLERRAQKRVKQLRSDIRQSPLVKRAESLREDTSRQLESGVDNVLAAFQIASKSDVKKLDRKLNQINRKLKELEKPRSRSSQQAASA
jgi:hypothetical protein